MWDIWDDEAGLWRESSVPCNPFPGNTRNHLIWQFERVIEEDRYAIRRQPRIASSVSSESLRF